MSGFVYICSDGQILRFLLAAAFDWVLNDFKAVWVFKKDHRFHGCHELMLISGSRSRTYVATIANQNGYVATIATQIGYFASIATQNGYNATLRPK